MKFITKTVLLLSIIAFVGCNNFYLPFERKLKVQQGNIVTPAMLSKVKRGMTKHQVSFLLGTAVLESTFDSSRWDYVYTYQVGNDPMEFRRASIYFNKQHKVTRIQQVNIKADKHIVPVSHSKKTQQAKEAEAASAKQKQPTGLIGTKTAPSASGKPRAPGAKTTSQNMPN